MNDKIKTTYIDCFECSKPLKKIDHSKINFLGSKLKLFWYYCDRCNVFIVDSYHEQSHIE